MVSRRWHHCRVQTSTDPVRGSPAATAAPRAAEPLSLGFVGAWLGFCLLMVLVSLQEQLVDGGGDWGWRLADELLAMALVSVLAVARWRLGPRDDALLTRPRLWFWRVLRWTPLVALAFVLALYAARHALRAALGGHYEHAPWPAVLGYESAKFAVFYALFAGVQFGHRSFRALAAERLRREQAQRLAELARLQQLTQQLRPHFLFNALNTVGGLVHDDPDAADRALLDLAALLRAASDASARPSQALRDELALARAYAGLMARRHGPRVQLGWRLDPALDEQPVPTLALQVLLENAFVHGVEQRIAPTHISVRSQSIAGPGGGPARLRLSVHDSGGRLAAGWRPGLGLANLAERLRMLHGDAATLLLTEADGGVLASIEWPLASDDGR